MKTWSILFQEPKCILIKFFFLDSFYLTYLLEKNYFVIVHTPTLPRRCCIHINLDFCSQRWEPSSTGKDTDEECVEKTAFSVLLGTNSPLHFVSRLIFSFCFYLLSTSLKNPFLYFLSSLTKFNSSWIITSCLLTLEVPRSSQQVFVCSPVSGELLFWVLADSEAHS